MVVASVKSGAAEVVRRYAHFVPGAQIGGAKDAVEAGWTGERELKCPSHGPAVVRPVGPPEGK